MCSPRGRLAVSGTLSQSIYFARNIAAAAAGTNTVTVKFNTPATYPDIRILEDAGLDINSPLDVSAAGSGSSATASSGSASTTTYANDLLFAADMIYTSTPGPGTGYTARVITVPDSDLVEDETVGSTGTYSATAPLSTAGAWVMQNGRLQSGWSEPARQPTPPYRAFQFDRHWHLQHPNQFELDRLYRQRRSHGVSHREVSRIKLLEFCPSRDRSFWYHV